MENPELALARQGITNGYHFKAMEGVKAILPNARWGSLNDIKRAIQSKIEKLIAYTKFDENDLFIHVIDASDEVNSVIKLISIQDEMTFDYIYLWDGNDLAEIRTDDGNAKMY